MSDSESIKKMLRSVLQSSKQGVSLSSLQSEYRSLCGESIPLKKLGFSQLEDYLRSIPSVVRLEFRMGELKCFAAVCQETAHIAELVARQKSSKKSGHSQIVNCKMRFKPSNPYMLSVRPRSSLRQPSFAGASKWVANRSRPHSGFGGCSAAGDYRKLDKKLSSIVPVERRMPAHQSAVKQNECQKPKEKPPEQVSKPSQSQSGVYIKEQVQNRMVQLLEKYTSGLWMSKLPQVYSEMFNQMLHPQALIDLEKWTHICMVEEPSSTRRADRLVYPPLSPKPSTVPQHGTTTPPSPADSSITATPISSRPSSPEPLSTPISSSSVPKPRVSPLVKPTFIFPPQPVSASSGKLSSTFTLRSPLFNPALAPRLPPRGNPAVNGGCEGINGLSKSELKPKQNSAPLTPSPQPGPDILPLLKATFSPTSNSAPCPPPKCSSSAVSDEVRQRTKELLSMYSHGLWADALPKLFMDTYKIPFPEYILDNLSLLLDICNVEYPISNDKKKAILYNSSRDSEGTDGPESQQGRGRPPPSGLEVVSPVVPPPLVPPSEQYPSVLITDSKSSNVVTIRYVGEDYSNAQEAMENAMQSFYSKNFALRPLSKPVVGQLVAVRGEDGDELARAQVMEVIAPSTVKVYYVDHGFCVETSGTNLLELHKDFLSLPFQATNLRVAGLEAFSSHPTVQASLEKLAVGKILLMETLEPCQQREMPMVVLYDTSQDDDVNINSTCLKALQDNTMNNPLNGKVIYQEVCVTNVSADGIIYCQLPCRGTARLCKLLEETEAIFSSQVTSESLVSRPFTGKFCLARHKGKWSRVEITIMYGNRVMEVFFIDLGVTATVEVTDLREFPPLFITDFAIIPPQATKCRLADITVPEGDWSPEAILWIKEAVRGSEDCKMKILKLDKHNGDCLVYMYLFIGSDGQQLEESINHQLARSELWHKVTTRDNNSGNVISSSNSSVDTGVSALDERLMPGRLSGRLLHRARDSALPTPTTKTASKSLSLPPPLELPQPGQNMDVFVPVACHPGHFVLQQWHDQHKLMVLMGEMILYYNQALEKTSRALLVNKGEVCAAKIEKNWHRVQVKGILANGLVSVYELDHGKHELVHSSVLQPLIEEFRQLPFQAIIAQLAGVTQHQWTEEASMLFRNHVEHRALVAQVESVQELSEVKGELWERRLTVYLVDTTLEDRDLWIHDIMANIGGELSSAA